MKRILTLISVALTLVSCEELFTEKEPSSCTIKASAVQECIMTKVSVDMVNGKMTWQPSDTLAVCTGSSFSPFIPDSTGISVADFKGKVPASAIEDCAVYPWSCSPSISGGNLHISLPGRMEFANNVVPAPFYAPAEEWETYGIFYLKQMGGILRVQLPSVPSDDVAYVTILSKGKKMCGDFEVIRDRGTAYYETCESSVDTALRIDYTGTVAKTKNLCCPLPVGNYGDLLILQHNAAGDTLSTYRTDKEVVIERGCVHQAAVVSTIITTTYCKKVTESLSDWSGEYLLVAENAGKAYILVTDSSFSDLNSPVISITMDDKGLPQETTLSRCILTVTPHKADESGVGPTRDQGGKYSILIQDGRGIGRYARSEFGFNNNDRYGRFVNSISINADTSMLITCTTKNNGEATLKFDLTGETFGFALDSQKSSKGYLPVYFYKMK